MDVRANRRLCGTGFPRALDALDLAANVSMPNFESVSSERATQVGLSNLQPYVGIFKRESPLGQTVRSAEFR